MNLIKTKMKKIAFYLILAFSLAVISHSAKAQNGNSPLIGSTHNYSVTPEDATGNTLLWTISGGTGYVINSGEDSDKVNITWTAAGSYTLVFTETNTTTLCSTVKQITVNVGGNTFDVSTSNPDVACNYASGKVNYSGTDATTSISFVVDMASGASGWNPDWEIEFALTPGAGATIDNVTVSEGTLSGSGPYTLTDLTSASGTGSVTITMDVTGDINTILTAGLEITSATELMYNTADVDSDDWNATQTINSIPATSTISAD